MTQLEHSKQYAIDRFQLLNESLSKGPSCTTGIVTIPSENNPKYLLVVYERQPDGLVQAIPIGVLFASPCIIVSREDIEATEA